MSVVKFGSYDLRALAKGSQLTLLKTIDITTWAVHVGALALF